MFRNLIEKYSSNNEMIEIIEGKVRLISLSIHGGIHGIGCGGYNVSIEILPQCGIQANEPWCKGFYKLGYLTLCARQKPARYSAKKSQK